MIQQDPAKVYSAAMDSVNLINLIVANTPPYPMSADEKADVLRRNVDHLKIQVARTNFWTNEDLTPLNNAITAGTPAS